VSRRPELVAVLSRSVVVVAVGALATALLVWAAATPRPPRVISVPTSSSWVTHGYDDVELRPVSEINAPKFVGARVEASALDRLLGWLSIAVVVLAVLGVLALLVRALWRAWRDRPRIEPDDTTAPDLERVAAAVVTDSEGRFVALAGGSPAEGIVAAWTRLEDTLRGAGVALPESRTSTETTVDVLRRFRVDEEALRELAALYREASWSSHPMTEADRDRAEAGLRRLDTDLAAVAPRTVRG
jgi:hypothetical protein